MSAAAKAERAMIGLNREYLMTAMQTGDEEYINAFNAMMLVIRRLKDEQI